MFLTVRLDQLGSVFFLFYYLISIKSTLLMFLLQLIYPVFSSSLGWMTKELGVRLPVEARDSSSHHKIQTASEAYAALFTMGAVRRGLVHGVGVG